MTASVLKACAISVCCMSMSLSCCACVRVMTAVIVLVRRLVEVRMAAAGRKILARFTRLRMRSNSRFSSGVTVAVIGG